jgi:hypothetical protein
MIEEIREGFTEPNIEMVDTEVKIHVLSLNVYTEFRNTKLKL